MIKRIKQWLEKKQIHWHKSSDPSDRRLWMYIRSSCLTIERHFLRDAHHCSVMLHLNSQDNAGFTINLCLPRLISIYVSLESHLLHRLMPGEWQESSMNPGEKFFMPVQRQIGVRIFDQAIWFSLWDNPMEWSSTDPKWWAFNFRPIDLLFGRDRIVAEKTKLEESISIRMPEGIYEGKLKLYSRSNKRPRWPTVNHFDGYDIEMDDPIPVPGKGENSWDCGQDAIYSISGPASTAARAIISLLDSVNTSRVRYGGAMWLPEKEPGTEYPTGTEGAQCQSS